MRLSEETLSILKNFCQICPQILIRPGSVLRTGTISDTLQAKAFVKEVFPREIAIYDIQRFLSVLSMFKEHELEFAENYIRITQGSQEVRYSYAAASMVYTPDDDEPKLKEHVIFDVTTSALENVAKALSILKQTELAIVGHDGKISLETLSVRNETSDRYRVELAETDREFTAIIKKENFLILPNDYQVVQDLRGMTCFRNAELTYHVSNEEKSKFPKL